MATKAHEFVPSRVNPAEWHLLVRVQSDRLEDVLAEPELLTTFAALDLPDKPGVGSMVRNGKAVDTWLLTKMEQADENWVQFRFVPPKTKAEMNSRPFRSGWVQRPFTWPALISKPRFRIDPVNPRVAEDSTGVIFLPRGVIEIDRMEAPQSGFWTTRLEVFVSPTEFTEDMITSSKPLAKPVEIKYHGDERQFTEVLHPGFTVPRQAETPVRSGGSVPGYEIVDAVQFPPTNYQQWAPFVLRDEPSWIDAEGVWMRERETIFPPSLKGRNQR